MNRGGPSSATRIKQAVRRVLEFPLGQMSTQKAEWDCDPADADNIKRLFDAFLLRPPEAGDGRTTLWVAAYLCGRIAPAIELRTKSKARYRAQCSSLSSTERALVEAVVDGDAVRQMQLVEQLCCSGRPTKVFF